MSIDTVSALTWLVRKGRMIRFWSRTTRNDEWEGRFFGVDLCIVALAISTSPQREGQRGTERESSPATSVRRSEINRTAERLKGKRR